MPELAKINTFICNTTQLPHAEKWTINPQAALEIFSQARLGFPIRLKQIKPSDLDKPYKRLPAAYMPVKNLDEDREWCIDFDGIAKGVAKKLPGGQDDSKFGINYAKKLDNIFRKGMLVAVLHNLVNEIEKNPDVLAGEIMSSLAAFTCTVATGLLFAASSIIGDISPEKAIILSLLTSPVLNKLFYVMTNCVNLQVAMIKHSQGTLKEDSILAGHSRYLSEQLNEGNLGAFYEANNIHKFLTIPLLRVLTWKTPLVQEKSTPGVEN